jgi:hypothetical protein
MEEIAEIDEIAEIEETTDFKNGATELTKENGVWLSFRILTVRHRVRA